MLTEKQAQAQIEGHLGKTVALEASEDLASYWAADGDEPMYIRFYADIGWLKTAVISDYQDYLEEAGDFVDDDSAWVHPSIIPFATVGWSREDDDDSFFGGSFAFLFWDLETGHILSNTTDEWDFDDVGDSSVLKVKE